MWKITSINNKTKQLTLRHTSGEQLSLVIPDTHSHSSKLTNEYIKSKTDAQKIKAQVKEPKTLLILLAIETIIVIALLIAGR